MIDVRYDWLGRGGRGTEMSIDMEEEVLIGKGIDS